MATQLIITIPNGLNDQEKEDLRYLLSDALAEFSKGVRSNPEDYVRDRHSWMTEESRGKKIEQVRRRTRLASKLHDPALNLTINDVFPEKCPRCGEKLEPNTHCDCTEA